MKNQPRLEEVEKGVTTSVSIYYFENKYFHNFLVMLKYPMGHQVGRERMILRSYNTSKRNATI